MVQDSQGTGFDEAEGQDPVDDTDDIVDDDLESEDDGFLPEDEEAEVDPDSSGESDDFDARAAIEELTGSAIRGTDLEAALTPVRRQLGHVPALQRSMSAIQDEIQSQSEAWQTITEVLSPMLDDEARSKLSDLANRQQLKARVAEELKRRGVTDEAEGNSGQDDGTEEAPQDLARRTAATARVQGYARAKGIDPTKIPVDAWQNAASQANFNWERAAELLEAEVDKMAQKGAAGQRRARRKESGQKQQRVERGGGANGTLTKERLASMSQEEIAQIPDEELFKVLGS